MQEKEYAPSDTDIGCSLLIFLTALVPGLCCGVLTFLEVYYHDPNRILYLRHLLKPIVDLIK